MIFLRPHLSTYFPLRFLSPSSPLNALLPSQRRIDRDYRTLHHLLSRLNHRQKDRNLGAIANVLSKSIVDTRLSSLGESIVPRNSANYKKAAVERVEAVDREDDEEVKKKTWWEKAIKKLKTKTNAASPEDKRVGESPLKTFRLSLRTSTLSSSSEHFLRKTGYHI